MAKAEQQQKPFKPVALPVVSIQAVMRGLEKFSYEVRSIGSGRDGLARYAVHRRDPQVQSRYQPRSYFCGECLLMLSALTSKQGIRDAIVAAQITKVSYINIAKPKEEIEMSATTTSTKAGRKRSSAATEKAKRDALAASKNGGGKAASKKAAPAKAKATTKEKAARAKKSSVDLSDPDVVMLSTYQEQTIERMQGEAVVSVYKRMKSATYDKPLLHKSLPIYHQRIARELIRLGVPGITKDNIPDVGLGYFGAQPQKAKAVK